MFCFILFVLNNLSTEINSVKANAKIRNGSTYSFSMIQAAQKQKQTLEAYQSFFSWKMVLKLC